jgi:hypothetical protein
MLVVEASRADCVVSRPTVVSFVGTGLTIATFAYMRCKVLYSCHIHTCTAQGSLLYIYLYLYLEVVTAPWSG